MEPVRWGVMGVASIAMSRMVPAIAAVQSATLHGIASRSLAKAQSAADQLGCKAYGSYDDLVADPDIEAIYMPLPTGLHAEWCIKSMRANKHVLCEKPIAMNAEEARQVQAVSAETGKVCLEGFAFRFNPVIAKAIEIANSGALGKLKAIHTSLQYHLVDPDPNNVRLQAGTGGGALFDVGCYCLNLQRMLAGREPLKAQCSLEWYPQYGVDMNGAGVLDYGDDLFGTFDFSFVAPGFTNIRVVGDKGMLLTPHSWGPPENEVAFRMITNDGVDCEITIARGEDDFICEMRNISDHIRGITTAQYLDEPLESTIRVIDACYKSDKTGKTEVV